MTRNLPLRAQRFRCLELGCGFCLRRVGTARIRALPSGGWPTLVGAVPGLGIGLWRRWR